MLLNIFRAVFVIILLSVLFVSVSSTAISGQAQSLDFWVVVWVGLGMGFIALFMDIMTPKKSLAALAGVFFGMLVGIFISWCSRRLSI